MRKIKISIGILTHNRPVELVRLLDSICLAVMQESRFVYEIVIANNGNFYIDFSSISEKFGRTVSSLRIINLTNSTASYGRNTILVTSSSNLVLLIDDDCCVPAKFFWNLYRELLKKKVLNRIDVFGLAPNINRKVCKNSLDTGYLLSGMDHYFTHSNNKGLALRFTEVSWSPTACILVKKDMLKEYFIVDSRYNVGGEDVIWGIENTIKQGKKFLTSKSVCVNHSCIKFCNRQEIYKFIRKAILYGKSEFFIYSHTKNFLDDFEYCKKVNWFTVFKTFLQFLYCLLAVVFTCSSEKLIASLLSSAFKIGSYLEFSKNLTYPRTLSLTTLARKV